MKKLLSILLVCFLILPLVGCPSEPPHVVREKVGLVVLAGQSGARGKALVSDLDEEYKDALYSFNKEKVRGYLIDWYNQFSYLERMRKKNARMLFNHSRFMFSS